MSLTDEEILSAFKELNARVDQIEAHLAHMGHAMDSNRAPVSPDIPPQVVELARRGKKIEAIKVLRQATGASLQQAKHVVDRIR